MPSLVDDVLVLLRVGGAAIALIWLFGLMRVRRRPAFDGQRRVELIAVAFILCGLAAIAASFVRPVGQ